MADNKHIAVVIYLLEKEMQGPGLDDYDWDYLKNDPWAQEKVMEFISKMRWKLDEFKEKYQNSEPKAGEIWKNIVDGTEVEISTPARLDRVYYHWRDKNIEGHMSKGNFTAQHIKKGDPT